MNLLRGLLYGTAFAAPSVALATIWWHLGATVTILIAAALAWITIGYIEATE